MFERIKEDMRTILERDPAALGPMQVIFISGSIGGESNFTGDLERKHAEDQCQRKVGQYVCF